MKESELNSLLEQLNDGILSDVEHAMREKSKFRYYHLLEEQNLEFDQALFEIIHEVARETMKSTITIMMGLLSGIEEDKIDMREVIKRIK